MHVPQSNEFGQMQFESPGAVQHGASTLPEDAFHKFPEVETAEVHLATQFQNMVYDSNQVSSDLKNKIRK